MNSFVRASSSQVDSRSNVHYPRYSPARVLETGEGVLQRLHFRQRQQKASVDSAP